MRMWRQVLVVVAFWQGTALVGSVPLNCQQAFASGDVNSGEKLLYNSSGTSFNAWCWYSAVTDEGLLYLSKDAVTNVSVDFSQFNVDTNRVALTFFTKITNTGQTYRGDLRRIDGTDVTVLQSTSTGFQGAQNADAHPNYLFLGILRVNETNVVHQWQGLQLNGGNCLFRSSDGNPNSYFAFFTEALSYRGNTVRFLGTCLNNNPLTQDSENGGMPSSYRFYYEAHFGGGGAYVTSNNLKGYEAGNVGLWFAYDSCGDPGVVDHSVQIVSGPAFSFGSTVTHICGELVSGDQVRTCQRETGWSGEKPTCREGTWTILEPRLSHLNTSVLQDSDNTTCLSISDSIHTMTLTHTMIVGFNFEVNITLSPDTEHLRSDILHVFTTTDLTSPGHTCQLSGALSKCKHTSGLSYTCKCTAACRVYMKVFQPGPSTLTVSVCDINFYFY